MDKRLLGILLVAASLYYLYRKDSVASSNATQSQLDYVPVTPFNNANSSALPAASNQIDYQAHGQDDFQEVVQDNYYDYSSEGGLA